MSAPPPPPPPPRDSRLTALGSFRRGSTFSVSTSETSGSLHMLVYPFHMLLDVWVEARNILGANESQHLLEDAGWFGERALALASAARSRPWAPERLCRAVLQ